ncbi:head-specific guanylate cyclase isoform X1 [Drosophila erecta]|uniref:head-specific guanylate cyclase isoform X1 n=1 Tax=Drosophila erecta TaxID=7220 RepID=UPI000F04CF28|nr:head-specific guanylate cyclase isoform X1 [Drosophila erecta]XP_026839729.1 head-specific guanylate cyclase isoform X1 [Drosophila erecta]
MACPFFRRADSLTRQPSVIAEPGGHWALEDEELSDDALTLTHLQMAIQLLTAPSNEDLNTAVTSLVAKYRQNWPNIHKLKLDPQTFKSCANYDYLADIQELLLKMDEASASEILVLLGEELITCCCTGIIERAFRCLGTDLQEFLGSLDGVYDVLKLQEQEDVTDTGFVCAGEGELIFTSERPVIAWLLLGSLKALTRMLYKVDVNIKIEPVEGDARRYRYLFSLVKDNSQTMLMGRPTAVSKTIPETVQRSNSSNASDLQMNSSSFCKMFPWHFIMNEQLELVQLGRGFSKLYKPYMADFGCQATTYFDFKRPKGLTMKFRDIVRRTYTPFLIGLNNPPGAVDFPAIGLEIKGQMVHCPESNSLLFIGSPFLDGLDGLTCNGLFISDIPLHDATREVILVGEQARAQDGLRRRMDKIKNSIEEANSAVTKERKKNVSLLHLIFPAEIAEKLWLGSSIDAKTYPDVTILFSDIVGFTSICSRATPFMVISMLEGLYKDFDEFCDFFDVYKVETIGDAYCVASGLHRASIYDAHKVAWMALKMIDACSKHITHDGEQIKMRIGLHTGTVLAGVVGRKMPRYCLFGHSVTIANKFESGSEALKINVSPTTKDWLTKHEGFEFELQPRDPSFLPKEFPNPGGTETCYFLESFRNPALDSELPLVEHINVAMKTISEGGDA